MPSNNEINSSPTDSTHLKVYLDKSVLVNPNGECTTFNEGKLSSDAKARLRSIKQAFEEGFLPKLIAECKTPEIQIGEMPDVQLSLIKSLVGSVTSEVGRGLVGLTVLQLCVKTICPEQSIRLHKGSIAARFSWSEGLPMRVLDKNFVTPVLREFGLLRLNADGIMMTRSLAENYPYTKLYKAALRGAKPEWLEIIELAESGVLNPESGLKLLILCLLNRRTRFQELAEQAMATVSRFVDEKPSADGIKDAIANYITTSSYSARVFEVAMHSLFQTLDSHAVLGGYLKKLCQMRSANKKHGNIADVEVTIQPESLSIIEGWDAKYGKPYLREELDELNEKLESHSETEVVGFVVDRQPDLPEDIIERKKEIEGMHNVSIHIVDFSEWVEIQLSKVEQAKDKTAREWLLAFAESLCQRRRHIAPIDEPCDVWVLHLLECFGQKS